MKSFQRWCMVMGGVLLAGCGQSESSASAGTEGVRLRVTVGEEQAIVQLYDHAAAKALVEQLPLTLTLEDFNRTEKIATLPKRLEAGDAPTSCTPVRGTFAYYIPWGNICFFYRAFRASENLIPLGMVEGDAIRLFEQSKPFSITLEVLP